MIETSSQRDDVVIIAGPQISSARAAYLHCPNFPCSGGYPFLQVDHDGCVYELVGQGLFAPGDATRDEVAALYSVWADSYDRSHPWVLKLGTDIGDIICARVQEPITVLDACCGTGYLTLSCLARIEDLGGSISSVVLVDISREMLVRAIARLSKYRPSSRTADYLDYKADRPFNVIICSLAINHFSTMEVRIVAEQIRQSLTLGGMAVIVSVPSRSSHRDRRNVLLDSKGLQSNIHIKRYISAGGVEFDLEICELLNESASCRAAVHLGL